MSDRLKLRRGVVISENPLMVEIGGEHRPAWADTALLGEMRTGDEVVVNVAARDLGLGSGGFDVVHVNLTRGLDASPAGDAHVIKLNYTSLQHPIDPVELPVRYPPEREAKGAPKEATRTMPVLVLPLHGHLAPAAWAAAQAKKGLRLGYIQTAGGALPGSLSRDVAQLRDQDLLQAHITVAPTYGGTHEALSATGALDAAANALAWDAALIGPGPGIIGSDTHLGHGGIAALDNAHAALALGLPTYFSPRLSESDPRDRHRGISHHTLTVLELLLGEVNVVIPTANPTIATQLSKAAGSHHKLQEAPADLPAYTASGLPTQTMGRSIEDDPLFFAAPLAAGAHLGAILP